MPTPSEQKSSTLGNIFGFPDRVYAGFPTRVMLVLKPWAESSPSFRRSEAETCSGGALHGEKKKKSKHTHATRTFPINQADTALDSPADLGALLVRRRGETGREETWGMRDGMLRN